MLKKLLDHDIEMNDRKKTKEHLILELNEIRGQAAGLKKALSEAAEERARSQAVIDAIGDAVSIHDADFRILYQNRVAKDLLGAHEGEFCFKAYQGRDSVCEVCHTARVFEDGMIHKKEGKAAGVYTEITAAPLKDSTGKIVAAVEVTRDITFRKHSEARLRQSNERLRTVLDASPAAIIAMDSGGVVTLWNKSAERIFGWNEAEVAGRPCPLVPERKPARVRVLPGQGFRGLSIPSVEERRRRKDGSLVDVLISECPIYEAGGRAGGLLAVITDITDRKTAERELELAHEELKQIFDTAVDGKLVLDRQFNVVRVNDTFLNMFGMSRQDVLGRKCYETSFLAHAMCHTESCPASRILRGEERVDAECETHLRDGTKLIFAVKAIPFRNPCGELIGIVENLRDMSESRKMEEALQKAEKLESVGLLAGGIAHDFNNLLQGVFGYISMAKRSLNGNIEAGAMLEQAEKALGMSVNLTTQLLTFSRGGKPVTRRIKPGTIIENSAKFALSGARSKAKIVIDEDLWDIDADPGQIGQVIQNIVINANEATPDGGSVEISARNIEIGKGDLAKGSNPLLPDGGKFVLISIRDSGIGIPGQYLSRIFDPYFTTKQRGSGLGLSTSYSIVRNHGGAIEAASGPNGGSVFTVYLPASGRAEEEAHPASASKTGRKGKILVMDDEDILRDIVKEMVQSLGHIVEGAANGEEAIDRVNRATRSGDLFDVVILDLTVRGGMGGEETVRRIREIAPGTKAVLSSGYGEGPVISDYRSYGFAALLNKPYLIDTLKDTLDSLLQ
ncbi:MAG: PAS domain S-box protein [Nitrospiraceae bacterium]|nr:PAS domain S-box protein [Nitrospiraceae bacterium]